MRNLFLTALCVLFLPVLPMAQEQGETHWTFKKALTLFESPNAKKPVEEDVVGTWKLVSEAQSRLILGPDWDAMQKGRFNFRDNAFPGVFAPGGLNGKKFPDQKAFLNFTRSGISKDGETLFVQSFNAWEKLGRSPLIPVTSDARSLTFTTPYDEGRSKHDYFVPWAFSHCHLFCRLTDNDSMLCLHYEKWPLDSLGGLHDPLRMMIYEGYTRATPEELAQLTQNSQFRFAYPPPFEREREEPFHYSVAEGNYNSQIWNIKPSADALTGVWRLVSDVLYNGPRTQGRAREEGLQDVTGAVSSLRIEKAAANAKVWPGLNIVFAGPSGEETIQRLTINGNMIGYNASHRFSGASANRDTSVECGLVADDRLFCKTSWRILDNSLAPLSYQVYVKN